MQTREEEQCPPHVWWDTGGGEERPRWIAAVPLDSAALKAIVDASSQILVLVSVQGNVCFPTMIPFQEVKA